MNNKANADRQNNNIRNKYSAALMIMMLFMTAIFVFTGCSAKQSQDQQSDDQTGKQTEVSIDYDTAVVSYLGPEGTYTEEACEQFFGGKGRYLPYETVDEAVQALEDGESNYAVIPQENTIGGAVSDYIDTLINHAGIAVAGEVELPIDQNLLTLPGAELSGIRTVYSHKQGIAQGKEWLEKNYKDRK